tara:strand:+ start:787 stop:1566 length:780 start_codon:yes stop_codon:yes gene_type:complete
MPDELIYSLWADALTNEQSRNLGTSWNKMFDNDAWTDEELDLLNEYADYVSSAEPNNPYDEWRRSVLGFSIKLNSPWNERRPRSTGQNKSGVFGGPVNWGGHVIVILTFAARRKLNEYEHLFLKYWLDTFTSPQFNRDGGSFYIKEYEKAKPRISVYTSLLSDINGLEGTAFEYPQAPPNYYAVAAYRYENFSGSSTGSQSQDSQNISADVAIPVVPFMPKWSDKIVEKFHRSTDPEIQEYSKALDDWVVSVENILKGG